MGNTTSSPNMFLPIPTVGIDGGPDWATNLNACLSLIDQHNHSAGSGVQINTAGLNINSDLPINSNNLTLVRSTRLIAQVSPISSATDLGCIYVSGVDLWYNDTSGNQIQLTASGTVNATSSGISSGGATASFSAGVLVVNAASLVPANIQGASLLLGNNTSGSKYLTLSPPAAMASNYSLVLPSIPSSQSFLTLDTSGNISAYAPIAQGITRNNLAAVGQQISSSCGAFTLNGSGSSAVTNLSVTITTTGRPVIIGLISDSGSTSSYIGATNSGGSPTSGNFLINRGATVISRYSLTLDAGTAAGFGTFVPSSSLLHLDVVSAGTYTYTVSVLGTLSGTNTIYVNDAKLFAYEL